MLKRVCARGVVRGVVRGLATGLLLATSLNVFAERVIIPPPYEDMRGKRLSSVEILAVNAYHESRGESDLANLMVMSVVLNRVADRRWPSSISGVVFQKAAFSWIGDKLSDSITDLGEYRRLYKLTEYFLVNKDIFLEISQGANHYHSIKITPYWKGSERMEYVMTVDGHKLYNWKDKARYRR